MIRLNLHFLAHPVTIIISVWSFTMRTGDCTCQAYFLSRGVDATAAIRDFQPLQCNAY